MPIENIPADPQARLNYLESELDQAVEEYDKNPKELGKRAVEIYSYLTKLKKTGGYDEEQFKRVASDLYNKAFNVK